MIYAMVEIALELLVRLARWAARNFRPLFALATGAGVGLAFGISLARYGGVDRPTLLMFALIGAVVVAPALIGFLNRIAPKG